MRKKVKKCKKSTKRRSIANARSYKFPGTLNKVVVFEANEESRAAAYNVACPRMDVDHETVVEGMNENVMEAERVEVADFLYFNRIVNIPMFWRSIKAFKHARDDCIGVDNVEIEKETNRGVRCSLHFRCSSCNASQVVSNIQEMFFCSLFNHFLLTQRHTVEV